MGRYGKGFSALLCSITHLPRQIGFIHSDATRKPRPLLLMRAHWMSLLMKNRINKLVKRGTKYFKPDSDCFCSKYIKLERMQKVNRPVDAGREAEQREDWRAGRTPLMMEG